VAGLTGATRERLDPQVRAYIDEVERERDEANRRVGRLQLQNEQLREEIVHALYKRFARSTEKTGESEGTLFAEAEQVAESDSPQAEAETTTVAEHTRTKRGRKPIDPDLPRVDIVHDIDESQKRCGCGHRLVRIGEEACEKVQVIPEQIWIERHIRPKYACHECEGSADEDRPAVRIAPAVASIIPATMVTASLLAFIVVNKYIDHLPLYRQEKRFERIGITIARQTMGRWIIEAAKRLKPLIQLFRSAIREGPLIHMDETPLQVLGEDGRANTSKSYMWLTLGGPASTPVCLYEYHPSRGREYPHRLLADYQGYVQADAWDVYARVCDAEPGITLVGCWAHARRKFHDAAKASKKSGAAQQALAHIRTLYRIEKELRAKDLDEATFVSRRRELAKPKLEQFHAWLTEKGETVLPSSLLGTAVRYTLTHWERLVRYLDLAELTPDNNAAENAIRPFCLGRRNWLFSGSPKGAEASCTMYSLIQTAKLNGFDPFAYLYYVFNRAPQITDENEWRELLPQNLDADTVKNAYEPLRVTG